MDGLTKLLIIPHVCLVRLNGTGFCLTVKCLLFGLLDHQGQGRNIKIGLDHIENAMIAVRS